MKVLIAGSIYGDFAKLKTIVDNLFAKGKKFDLLLCCGFTLVDKLDIP